MAKKIANKTKTKVHKIKAKTDNKKPKTAKKVATKVKIKESEKKVKIKEKNTKQDNNKKSNNILKFFNPIIRFNRYLVASWRELKNVRWPSRKETWQKVLSIIIYGLFFIVLVLFLDNIFDYLFKLMLGAK